MMKIDEMTKKFMQALVDKMNFYITQDHYVGDLTLFTCDCQELVSREEKPDLQTELKSLSVVYGELVLSNSKALKKIFDDYKSSFFDSGDGAGHSKRPVRFLSQCMHGVYQFFKNADMSSAKDSRDNQIRRSLIALNSIRSRYGLPKLDWKVRDQEMRIYKYNRTLANFKLG